MSNLSYLLIFLMLVGCGTRKVESEKLGSIEVRNAYSEGSKIVLGTNLTFTPFDNSRPFKVNGRQYDNVVVSNSTNKSIEKWKTKIIYRTKTIYQTKTVEKTDHSILYTSLFFISCLFIFLWIYLKKFTLAR